MMDPLPFIIFFLPPIIYMDEVSFEESGDLDLCDPQQLLPIDPYFLFEMSLEFIGLSLL